MLLNVVAVVVAFAMPYDDAMIERIGVLTVPTTLAATFVLIREQTALASRLQARSRIGLAATTALLWCVVLWLVMTFHLPS